MPQSLYRVGETITIDTDHEEWGRVTGTATVESVETDEVLVHAHRVRATLRVPRRDARPLGTAQES